LRKERRSERIAHPKPRFRLSIAKFDPESLQFSAAPSFSLSKYYSNANGDERRVDGGELGMLKCPDTSAL